MYNNLSIYDNLMTIIRKEKDGKSISENQFNQLLLQCSHETLNSEREKFELSQVITDRLRGLKSSVDVSVSGGVFPFITAITNDSKVYYFATNIYHDSGSVDIMTDKQYRKVYGSDLLQPTTEFSAARITGDNIEVLPDTITAITLEYIRLPDDPYFDYYHDANDKIQYLTEGSQYTLQAGETYIDKDDGTERTAGYLITSGENKTKELWLPQSDRNLVLYCMLQKLGVSLNEQDALQYGIAKEQLQ